MYSPAYLACSYAAFALLAMAANIAVQDCIVRIDGNAILVSVLVGTGAGLVVKYVLDKRYIFGFRPRNMAHDGLTFALYAGMGLVTTAVFWGFEFGFQYLFASKEMRYLGGIIGLSIGYLAKFHLDRRYVFRAESA